jgi:tRNA dimethylallyltransferase
MLKHGPYLIVIAGPTAVGKTAISIEIAKRFNTSIVNADSRQVYKELNIGVAKPTQMELNEVEHHFVNHCSIHEAFTASDYEQQCMTILDRLYETKDVIVMSGGTGLYIQAVLEGFDSIPDVPEHFVAELNEIHKAKGITHLQGLLQQCDPDYYEKVDKENPRRLIRAISVFNAHNNPYSSYLGKASTVRSFTPILIQVDRKREELYERINKRVDIMIAEGLEDEARSLYKFKNIRALQTVGYTEFFKYFDGEISKEEAISLIKQQTRRYAKRQLTWYRNKKNWQLLPADDLSQIGVYLDQKIM